MAKKPKPSLLAPKALTPVVTACLPIIGCNSCDAHPDFPRTHCGKPGCRDSQALAWAHYTGSGTDEALSAADGSDSFTGHSEPEEGLCSTCSFSGHCIVGIAVNSTARALEAKLMSCNAYRREK